MIVCCVLIALYISFDNIAFDKIMSNSLAEKSLLYLHVLNMIEMGGCGAQIERYGRRPAAMIDL